MSLEKIAKVLVDEDYKTLIRSHRWVDNHGNIVYTSVAARMHTETCEERIYQQDMIILPYTNEHVMKEILFERLIDDMLDDKFGGLEIKETYKDEEV